MTAYFDAAGARLSKIREMFESDAGGYGRALRQLALLDQEIVWDVSVASTFPGFPPELVLQIDEIVLRWSLEGQPLNSRGPDYVEVDDTLRGIGRMIEDLHTVFHDLSTMTKGEFSDGPRSPVRALASQAEERREILVVKLGLPLRALYPEENEGAT